MSTLREDIEKEIGSVMFDGSRGGLVVEELIKLFKQQMRDLLTDEDDQYASFIIRDAKTKEVLDTEYKTDEKKKTRNLLRAQLRQEVEKL